MNYPKKIKKLDQYPLPYTNWEHEEILEDRLTRTIDKLNEVIEDHNIVLDCIRAIEFRLDKLESQPEECEHDFSCSMSDYRKEHIECNKCKVPNPKKQIIYTSEGDAVGEVEKKCECNCAHRPHLDDCYLNHCPHKEKYEPKKD